MPTLSQIVDCVEAFAAPEIQEKWDNSGWQLRPRPLSAECSGVMLCLDVRPEVVDEAIETGCNLIISHHPMIFRGLKHITDATPEERAVIAAISAGVSVYSSHTALDSASHGVSYRLGSMLGLEDMSVLVPQAGGADTGLGIVGFLPAPMPIEVFVSMVKNVYGARVVRRSEGRQDISIVRKVALCSGSGGEFLSVAIRERADAYITSDTRYHDFVDFGKEILMVDTGHYESEICTKSIFSDIISEKFPNFAVRQSRAEQNPVRYV